MSKVFGVGDVTICTDSKSIKVYMGTNKLGFVSHINFDGDGNQTKLSITFLTSSDPEIQKSIEENIRLASSFPWIEVIRS